MTIVVLEGFDPTYENTVLIVLAAVTVVLTALAIFIGIAAVWGYAGIKNEAATAASDAVNKKLEEFFGNLDIQASLKAEVASRVNIEADAIYQDLAITGVDLNQARDEGEKRRVADPYPEGDEK